MVTGDPHPVVTGDVIHPGVCVDGRAAAVCDAGPVVRTFAAASTVEVRLALGGERDWGFDWVSFAVLPDARVKEDCTGGGWERFGFANQGQGVRFAQTGNDGREG